MKMDVFSKLSLNSTVKVKLNESGLSILKAQHEYYKSFIKNPDISEKYGNFINPSFDEDGYVEMKLWEIMRVFGDYCFYEGTQDDERYLPFEHEILINHEDLILIKDKSLKLKK